MDLRVNRIIKNTSVEGFGKRYSIWVQGCSIRCKGCSNKEMWSFDKGRLINVNDIINDVEKTRNIEGITFLGGEPFEQAVPLFLIASELRKKGLSIIIFSGYEYTDIIERNKVEWNQLLSVTDLLIDGRFEEEKYDLSRPWVGSSNQQYIFITDRYIKHKDELCNIKNRIELRIDTNGFIKLNGMADYNMFKEILL